jgi:hypothetical protein
MYKPMYLDGEKRRTEVGVRRYYLKDLKLPPRYSSQTAIGIDAFQW